MNRVIAELSLAEGIICPEDRWFVQAKLSDDSAPYGSWSLVVDPVVTGLIPTPVLVAFAADEAPHEQLLYGARLELFRGPTAVGKLIVTSNQYGLDTEKLPSDDNVLISLADDEDILGDAA